ncbi:Heparanase-like protein 1 [Apostasia shenzhenica]|uniref:Heparanase-like protein 1 n=1 Tax=Apostasia shenzhenica TaxID=1088818 RepID=A0A2I0ADP0_9ASPA|nr:Heparanase-like protein 1 [Apostasia shenzhenica]
MFSIVSPSLQDEVSISVKGVAAMAKTDEHFICATMDWWPPEKCNYGMCPWGNASIINLDLKNPILHNALKAFNPLRIRLGGSLQDQVVYKVGKNHPWCRKFQNVTEGLFGFSTGCLNMCRWDKLNALFNETGVKLTFGLNALYGRQKSTDQSYIGNWDSSNAHAFINYTVSKGYNVDSWELGNELCGSGVSARVDAKQYGKDLIALKAIVDDLYKEKPFKAKVLAPGGFYDKEWFDEMLTTSGPDVVQAVTHHIYNLGSGDDSGLIYKIQDPYYLDQIVGTFKDVALTVQNFGPWSSAWVGESGGAYNSGGRNVSDAFVDSFWYLDQLGMASTFDHKVYCRQALIGGKYALLDTNNFQPNPDYYSALLWHRLMGSKVLETTHNVINDMNLYPPEDNSSDPISDQGEMEVYHLTRKNGNLRSKVMLLNGNPLKLTDRGDIPEMNPLSSNVTLEISPLSIAFVRLKNFKAPACH